MAFITQQRSNLKYILIIVILAIIAGGGILWLTEQEISLIGLIETQRAGDITEDGFIGWQTYTNPKYSYSFSYKPDERMRTISCSYYGDASVIGHERLIFYRYSPTQPSFVDPSHECHTQGENHVLRVFFEVNKRSCQSTEAWENKESIIQVGGISASKCEESFVGERLFPGPDEIISVSIPDESGFIIIEVKDREFDTLFNQILSTFRLIEEDETVEWKTYKNEEYDFEITLLDSWEGYSVLVESWNGVTLDDKSTKFQGPEIVIRNPKWTEDTPWQDIPIMVFTNEEWELVEARNLNVSAAPVGPSKLGENQKYVFALPPRWVGFYDAPGQEEAKK